MRRPRRALALALLSLLTVAVGAGSARAANDPHVHRQWNMALVGAEQAWSVGSGAGAVIAVVDTGVHLTHEDLAVGDELLPGRNYITRDAAPQDDNGHGTHVTGIAAAAANNGKGVVGVAPNARIMPIKVLNASGRGSYTNVASAVRWAADNGAHVVNLSLGSTVGALFGDPDVFVDAIRYAWSKGVLCVVAAGNDFVLSSSFRDEPAIVVSATTPDDTAALYSNGVGDAHWGLAAPGGAASPDPRDWEMDVYSTYWPHSGAGFAFGPYEYLAGTSMAAPHVAGAAALLRSLGLGPQQTVDRLLQTAVDLGSRGRDDLYGHGRVDVAAAVSGLGPAGGSRGTTPTTAGGTDGRGRGNTSATTTRPGGTAEHDDGGPPSAAGVDGGARDGTDDGDDGGDQGGDGDGYASGESGRDGPGGDSGASGPAGKGDGHSGDGGTPPWLLVLGAVAVLAGAAIAAPRLNRRTARTGGPTPRV